MAGYVMKMGKRKISCNDCRLALTDNKARSTAAASSNRSRFGIRKTTSLSMEKPMHQPLLTSLNKHSVCQTLLKQLYVSSIINPSLIYKLYVPLCSTYRLTAFSIFFRVIFCVYCLKHQKVEKIDNNFILYHLLHARTCATSINAKKRTLCSNYPKPTHNTRHDL